MHCCQGLVGQFHGTRCSADTSTLLNMF
jgi:hypothetical protein